MKILVTIFSIIASSLIYTSCCKEPYPVAGVTVSYPNISNSETLKAARTDKNNLSIIIDTLTVGELNSSNNYSAFIEFENEPLNYIIYLENTQYRDTISEILVERKGCNDKIKNVQYKFNGQTRSDKKLTIN
jgi:hypothetical protein